LRFSVQKLRSAISARFGGMFARCDQQWPN
jgi:hypothetical protein